MVPRAPSPYANFCGKHNMVTFFWILASVAIYWSQSSGDYGRHANWGTCEPQRYKRATLQEFPNLARLPLVAVDRSNELYDTTPLTPTPRQRGWQQIIGNGGIWRSKEARYLPHLLIIALRGERRYYTRRGSINSPGWKAERKSAPRILSWLHSF